MTDQTRILELLHRRPMLRAVQIADQLDLSLDAVDAILRQQMIAGHVIEEEVTAPNNRPAMAYELSAQFKATTAGREIVAAHQHPQPAALAANPTAASSAPTTATPTAAPSPAPTTAPAAAPAAQLGVPRATKVDRAIACLTEHGTVATGQLRLEMGLRAGAHPSSYLTAALKDGRIVRDGDYWALGPGPRAASTAGGSQDSDPGIVTMVGPGAPRVAGTYRCALWSDGVLEVRKDGETVAELPQAAGESLAAFLNRLAREGAAA